MSLDRPLDLIKWRNEIIQIQIDKWRDSNTREGRGGVRYRIANIEKSPCVDLLAPYTVESKVRK